MTTNSNPGFRAEGETIPLSPLARMWADLSFEHGGSWPVADAARFLAAHLGPRVAGDAGYVPAVALLRVLTRCAVPLPADLPQLCFVCDGSTFDPDGRGCLWCDGTGFGSEEAS